MFIRLCVFWIGLVTVSAAPIVVGDGDRSMNFVLEFWDVPDPQPTDPATPVSELGSPSAVYWFDVRYSLSDLSPVVFTPTPPVPSIQQVMIFWSEEAGNGAGLDLTLYPSFGYAVDAIAYGGFSNAGFSEYYWSFYLGGTGATADWQTSFFGITETVADDGLWVGWKYTPSSWSFGNFDETPPSLVPEPGAVYLIGFGLLAYACRRIFAC
jgi:hypothetical protein